MRTPFPSLVRVPGSLSRVRTAAGSQAAPGPHTVCVGSPSSPSGTDWQTAKRPCCAARVAAPSAASVPRLGPRRSHSQHRASVPPCHVPVPALLLAVPASSATWPGGSVLDLSGPIPWPGAGHATAHALLVRPHLALFGRWPRTSEVPLLLRGQVPASLATAGAVAAGHAPLCAQHEQCLLSSPREDSVPHGASSVTPDLMNPCPTCRVPQLTCRVGSGVWPTSAQLHPLSLDRLCPSDAPGSERHSKTSLRGPSKCQWGSTLSAGLEWAGGLPSPG